MLPEIFAKYLKVFPEDEPRLKLLAKQIDRQEQLSGRTNYIGHITGSAVIFNPDKTKVLLIYHPLFDRWQQPGGHWDDDEQGPWLTAVRESIEETGVKLADQIPNGDDKRVPFDIDSHVVPASSAKKEPEHYHHDFKYAFIASTEKLTLKDEVIKEARWVDSGEIKSADLMRAISHIKAYL